MEIVIGKKNSKKSDYVKSRVNDSTLPTIILDYKNKYTDIEGTEIDLGEVNPFVDQLDYTDAAAFNAAIFEYESFFLRKAKDILIDQTPANENWETYRYSNLIYETINRCLNAWDNNEDQKMMSVRKHITFSKTKQTVPLEEVLTE